MQYLCEFSKTCTNQNCISKIPHEYRELLSTINKSLRAKELTEKIDHEAAKVTPFWEVI